MGGKKDEKNKKNSGGNTRSCAGNWTSRMWGIIPEKTGSSDRTKVSMVIFGGGGQDTFDNAAAKFNEMQDEIELLFSRQQVITISILVQGQLPMICRICFG